MKVPGTVEDLEALLSTAPSKTTDFVELLEHFAKFTACLPQASFPNTSQCPFVDADLARTNTSCLDILQAQASCGHEVATVREFQALNEGGHLTLRSFMYVQPCLIVGCHADAQVLRAEEVSAATF